MDIVHVDCDTCSVRGDACSDCVISVLLSPPRRLDLTDDEQTALGTLAAAGLVPPLRLVRGADPEPLIGPAADEPVRRAGSVS